MRSAIRWLLRRRLRVWFIAAFLAGLGWRAIRWIMDFPMWGDEAFVAANFLGRGYGDMLRRLEYDMVVPVGFMWPTLALADVFGRSERVLRFLPWVAGLVSLFMVAFLARKLLRPHAALVALAIFAASFYPVRYACEVKPYGFDMLASLLVIAAAHRLLDPGAAPRRAWWAFAACLALVPWFSYPVVFTCGGAVLVVLLAASRMRDWRAALAAIACGAALLASWCAMYSLIGKGQEWADERLGTWRPHFPPLDRPWNLPLWLVKEHTGLMFAYPNGTNDFGCAGTTILVVVGAAALWRKGVRPVVLLLLSPLPLMFIASALRKYPYGGSARTTLHLAGPICLLAGAGVVALLSWRLRPRAVAFGARIVTGLLILLIVILAVLDVAKPWKSRSDLQRKQVVTWLARETSDRDRWVVFGDFRPGEAPDMRSWRGTPALLRYHLHRFARVPLYWGARAEALDSPFPGRTWLIACRDVGVEFPEQLWAAWRRDFVEHFGEPVVHAFRPGSDSIEILEFGPRHG